MLTIKVYNLVINVKGVEIMSKDLQLVTQALSTLTALDSKQLTSEETYGKNFSLVIDKADELSRDQIRGIEALGGKLGLGRPQYIPSQEGLPPKYQFEGPIEGLKADVAANELESLRRSRERDVKSDVAFPKSNGEDVVSIPDQQSSAWERHGVTSSPEQPSSKQVNPKSKHPHGMTRR